jgi:flavodoxin I
MKTIIIYDSLYGNTEKIAEAIGQALAPQGEVILKKVVEAKIDDLEDISLLIVGSPTHGGRATPAMQEFLRSIPNGTLRNAKVAAFDTRFEEKNKGFVLRLVMKIFQFAAPRITRELKIKGVGMAIEPEGFVVEEKEGPLKAGELERAALWAKNIMSGIQSH